MTAEPHPQRCDNLCPCRTPMCEETCPEYQFQERFSIWLATHHDLPIEKHGNIVENASLIFDDLCLFFPAMTEREKVLNIINKGKSAIYEGMVDGYFSQINQAKMDMLCWIEAELRKQGGEQG